MFIIWRGWGIVVVPIALISIVIAVVIAEALKPVGLPGHWSEAIPMALTSVAAAAAIWFLAKSIGGRPSRRLVDPASGQQYVIRRDAGSLFFIPTRFWAFIVLVIGLLFAAALVAHVQTPDAKPVLSSES